MRSIKLLTVLIRGAALTCIILLFILGGFQGVPVFTGSDVQYINQAALQRVRSQIFVKSALLLEYVPADTAIALSDMQVSLPFFIAEEQVLLKNSQPDVQNSMLDLRVDYLALVAAVTVITNNPDTVTLKDQVTTILAVNKPYLLAINKVVLLLQNESDARFWQLFIIELIVDVILFLVAIITTFFCIRIIKQITQETLKRELVL